MNHLDCIKIIKNCKEKDGKTLLKLFDDWDEAWNGNAPEIKGYRLEYPEDDSELKNVCELFGYDVIINHFDYDLGGACETLYLINGLNGLEDKYKIDVYTFDEFKEILIKFIEDYIKRRSQGDPVYYKEESEWIWAIFENTLNKLNY